MTAKLQSFFMAGDLLRCLVVSVDRGGEACVSLTEEGLGPVSDMPAHYRRLLEHGKEASSYSRVLKHARRFNNPECVNLLRDKLGVRLKKNFSLLRGLYDQRVGRGERASDLLKQQNRQMALQSVQKGIACFKEGRAQDAVLCYNKALSIDEQNVEAYVARGALLANDGDFGKAICDLERALCIDGTHANAKVYLKQVLLANAVKLEKAQRYEDALVCLNKALGMEGECATIRTKIEAVQMALDRIHQEKEKDLYGPSLPVPAGSKKSKKHKKDRSKGADSRTTSRKSEK